MIGKKINQLATELAPVSTDLTIIGDPISGVSKKITLAQLGAIFSGAVSFYTNLAGFPATGDINVIYCAKDTQKLYLWSGSAYTEVFPSQALLDTYQLRSEKGVSNGYASLDSSGKVPISQLPSSIMEYKGTWNAATNTPTLANGTGDTGDVYICNVAGTVNFGAGPITFAVGDYVIYSGSIWQRSSGAVGTVTSVAVSRSGDALAITGSPITTSGTINIGFAGTGAQYIKGNGTLATFPSTIAQAERLITEVYNSTGATLTKGTIVYINGGQGNLPTVTKALATGDSTSAQTFGVVQADITNMNNGYVVVAGKLSDLDTQAYTEGTQLYLSSTTAGAWTSTKQYAPAHLVYVGIVVRSHPTQGIVEVKIQNGYELDELHDVAAQTPSNNDGLFWESATSLWKNKSIATVLGYTPQAQLNGTGFVKATGTTISYDNSTYVTTDTFQTISASKTFSVGLSLASAGGTNQLTSFINTSSLFSGSAGSNVLGFNSANNIYFGKGSNNGGVLQWTNSTVRYYTLPDATGTIALTSDIPSLMGYVPYTGATANVNLGTNDLLSRSVYIEGTASYQAGLLMKQISGFNFVTGAYTQVVPSGIYDLYVVHNQTNGTRRRYAISVASLQDGDDFQYLVPRKNGTFAMTSDIPSLTGYVQGSGTTNYLPKFTGTSTIGNSVIQEASNNIGIGHSPSYKFDINNVGGSSATARLYGNDQSNVRLRLENVGAGGRTWELTGGLTGADNSAFTIYDVTAATTRLQINASGNLGLGVTPSAWSGGFRFMDIGTGAGAAFGSVGTTADMTNNAFSDGSWTYKTTAAATLYRQATGQHIWYTAPSGTAGNAISFTQAMTLDASGRLGIGVTSPAERLDINGNLRIFSAGYPYIDLGINTSNYWRIINDNPNDRLIIGKNGASNFILNSSGAATFSSSVTATDLITSNTGFRTNALSGYILRDNANSVNLGGLTRRAFWAGGTALDTQIFAETGYSIFINPGGSASVGLTLAPTGAATFTNSVTIQGGNALFVNNAANTRSGSFYTSVDGTEVSSWNGAGEPLLLKSPVGYISMFTNGSERLRVNTSGNVGIGTTSPASVLEIREGNRTNGSNITNFGVYTTTAQNTDVGGTIGLGGLFNGSDIAPFGSIRGGKENSTSGNYAGYLAFQTIANNSVLAERMRITSGGNVLIGTTTGDGYKLQIVGNSQASSTFGITYSTVAAYSQWVNSSGAFVMGLDGAAGTTERFRIASNGAATFSSSVTVASSSSATFGALTLTNSASVANGNGSIIGFNINNNNGGVQQAAYIQGYNQFSVGNNYGNIAFYVANATSSATTRALLLDYTGAATFSSLGTGTVYSNGGTLTNTNPSDLRLKTNVSVINYGLNEILKLNPVTFNWKDDKINQGKKYAFIAQEVEKVMPDLVKSLGAEDYLGLDKEAIFTILIKAIQELNDKIK